MKNESFIKGTLILIISNAISKILGATLKIPLTYILGEQGMAIYQTAFSVYIMLLSLITSGIPFAISKYISEELALSRKGNVRFAMRFSVILMLLMGIFITTLMYFYSDFFALAMKDPKAPLAIRAIAPAIFFVALGAVYKSCYQGYAHQTPTAFSQVLEAFMKLIVGYTLASYFSAFSVKYSSAAAIFGVTVGEAFATLILMLLYIPYSRDTSGYMPESRRRDIMRAIFAVALPLTATSVISGSLSLLETSVIRNRLTSIIFDSASAERFLLKYCKYTDLFNNIVIEKKLSFDGARWLYGAFSGYAATVFNLPIGILASFGISILPIIARCIALNDKKKLSYTVCRTSKIILTLSVPCTVMLVLFSKDILFILFKNTASHHLLSLMAPLLIIVTLNQFIYSVLHSAGKIMLPFLYSIFCAGIKIILSYVLIVIPDINISGIILSSFCAALLQFFLCIRLLKKDFGIYLLTFSDTLKITASAAIMSGMALLLKHPLYLFLKNDLTAFIVCTVLAILSYLGCVFVFGVVTADELKKLKS